MSTIFAYGLVAGLLMLCWRLVLPRPLAIIAGGLWVLFSPLVFATHPWSSVYALVFQSAALMALMRALSAPGGRGWALTSGVMAALTLLARQFPTGFFTCGGVIAALVLVAVLFPTYRRRAVEAMIGAGVGMLVVLGLFFVHLVWQGALDQWWLQTVVWAFKWSQMSGGSGLWALQCLDMYWRDGLLFCAVAVPLLFLIGDRRSLIVGLAFALAGAAALLAWRFAWIESLGQGITPIAFVLTFAATVYVALRDRHAPRAETVMMLVAMVICLGSWTQVYPLGDPGHLFWAFVELWVQRAGGVAARSPPHRARCPSPRRPVVAVRGAQGASVHRASRRAARDADGSAAPGGNAREAAARGALGAPGGGDTPLLTRPIALGHAARGRRHGRTVAGARPHQQRSVLRPLSAPPHDEAERRGSSCASVRSSCASGRKAILCDRPWRRLGTYN
jgi:hypothetical protein